MLNDLMEKDYDRLKRDTQDMKWIRNVMTMTMVSNGASLYPAKMSGLIVQDYFKFLHTSKNTSSVISETVIAIVS